MHSEPEGRSSLPDGLSHRMVRTQLEKILASDMFCRSERLSAFLRFVVDETLKGNGDTLKEQVLAAAVYGKRVGFSGGDDATVRNDARRLRDKLREYYAESARDPIIVTLPKGAYTPTFEANAQSPLPTIVPMRAPEAPAMAKPRWTAAILAAAGCLALAIGYWTWSRTGRNDKPTSWNVEQVTSIPGYEGPPSLSPDGNFVAFSSEDRDHPGQSHIFIKAVRREALRRLTDSPDSDVNPAWSPDGTEIAFVRQGKGVFRVSQLGGPERKIADRGTRVGWAPDGKSVLIRDREAGRPFGISQVFLSNLDRRRLTQPSNGTGDFSFAVSPDGTTLAFTRYLRNGVSDVYRRSDEWRRTATADGLEQSYGKRRLDTRRTRSDLQRRTRLPRFIVADSRTGLAGRARPTDFAPDKRKFPNHFNAGPGATCPPRVPDDTSGYQPAADRSGSSAFGRRVRIGAGVVRFDGGRIPGQLLP